MATIDRRIDKNGNCKYRARARLKGFPLQTATFPSKTDARRWAQSIEAAMREGRYFPTAEAKRHTLADLITRYKRDVLPHKPRSARSQRMQLTWWNEQLGHCRLSDLTSAQIVECRDRLLSEPTHRGKRRAAATVVRYLAVLSHALSVAMKEWRWIETNPCRNVTKPKEARGRIRFLDDEERTRLLQACRDSDSAFLYLIVVLAIATGMRKTELLSLHWSQIDFAKQMITLHETKNGERHAIPLVGHAFQLLLALNAVRQPDTPLVFPSNRVAKHVDVSKAWTNAVAKSGLEDFRFHDLRHTAASYLAQGGATPIDIAVVLGHKTLAMVKRYAHLGESRVRQVLADMNQRAFG